MPFIEAFRKRAYQYYRGNIDVSKHENSIFGYIIDVHTKQAFEEREVYLQGKCTRPFVIAFCLEEC